MAPSKDDRTLLSGASAPAEDDADQPTASVREEVPRSDPKARVEARQPSWSGVRPSGATTFGETERFFEKEQIGFGGMSTVVRAFDKDLRRDVAIKVLSAELSSSGAEVERFATEARITGQLEHPYIVPVYEFGNDPREARFLCMRLVQGQTLEDALNDAGALRLETDRLADFLQILVKVCEAVSFAHSRGVIHRDLKPSNVMISDFGQVYVLDWGVARHAPRETDSGAPGVDLGGESRDSEPDAPGTLVGTPCYMAPEQLRGMHDEVDERTDVFAIGATLYQILTGQPPRLPESIRSILMGEGRFEIPAPETIDPEATVPAELSRIAQKAMSHERERRYLSVGEMKVEIERFCEALGTFRARIF